jgi:uncharacterized protein with HEPN domain
MNVIIEFLKEDTFKSFTEDDYGYNLAVPMCLSNIGKMIEFLSPEVRHQYPEIPWEKLEDLKNIDYSDEKTFDLADIWRFATTELPILKKGIADIYMSNAKKS